MIGSEEREKVSGCNPAGRTDKGCHYRAVERVNEKNVTLLNFLLDETCFMLDNDLKC